MLVSNEIYSNIGGGKLVDQNVVKFDFSWHLELHMDFIINKLQELGYTNNEVTNEISNVVAATSDNNPVKELLPSSEEI